MSTFAFGIEFEHVFVAIAAEHKFGGTRNAEERTARNVRGQREESIFRFQVENDGFHSPSCNDDGTFPTDRDNLHTNHLTIHLQKRIFSF
jgi:hypothetical protein